MSPARSPIRPSGSGRRLDRAVIVETAITHIDRFGTQGLTMRRLGQDLGVEAMSLYRYIHGRADLIDAVIARVLDDLRDELDGHEAESWQRYLQVLAHAARHVVIDHPATFTLLATHHPAAPWLRAPLLSQDLVEEMLTTLSAFGFTDEQVVDAYRALTSFLLGQLLVAAPIRGDAAAPALPRVGATDPRWDSRDPTGGPTTTRLRVLLDQDHRAGEFEGALELLVDRLETRRGVPRADPEPLGPDR